MACFFKIVAYRWPITARLAGVSITASCETKRTCYSSWQWATHELLVKSVSHWHDFSPISASIWLKSVAHCQHLLYTILRGLCHNCCGYKLFELCNIIKIAIICYMPGSLPTHNTFSTIKQFTLHG